MVVKRGGGSVGSTKKALEKALAFRISVMYNRHNKGHHAVMFPWERLNKRETK